MPEHTTRILSTRSLDASLLREAAQQGIVLDLLPFIETRPVQDAAVGARVRELARSPLVAVFTSMNAVEAVADWLGEPGETQDGASGERDDASRERRVRESGKTQDGAPGVPWKIFCIGSATGQLVQEYFGAQAIAGTAGSALALAAEIIRQWPDIIGSANNANAGKGSKPDNANARVAAEVFFFCGDQRRDELPQTLAGQGIRVNECIVYTTIPTPHRVEESYDGIAFFSPSAVHSFFAVNTALPAATLLFAIGRTTAGAIRQYTANRTIVSGIPEKEALIRQAIDHFNNKTEQEPENHL